MLQIRLQDAGRRFRFDWIFKGLSVTLRPGERWAILGPNGSGKSTLLKVLSGHLSLSKGSIVFAEADGKALDPDQVYKRVAYAAPYIELIEEMTLEECLRFHTRLKPLRADTTPEMLLERLELGRARHKELRFFSSGMKQRLKLGLAICSDTPLLLLDEPTTNLDLKAVEWFHRLLADYAGERLVIIASNDPGDLALCGHTLQITEFK